MSGLDILFSDNQKEAMKKLEIFEQRIKKEITDKDDKLKSILDVNGENPKQLHELIDFSNTIDRFDYFINGMYEIPKNIETKIKDIYNSVFE